MDLGTWVLGFGFWDLGLGFWQGRLRPFSAEGRIGPAFPPGNRSEGKCFGRAQDISSHRRVAETETGRGTVDNPRPKTVDWAGEELTGLAR